MNRLVKHFLYGGRPDEVWFDSRVQQILRVVAQEAAPAGSSSSSSTASGGGTTRMTTRYRAEFDLGGGAASGVDYDAIVIAMPPKDIIRLFETGAKGGAKGGPDPQSQADLHRRFNKGRTGKGKGKGNKDQGSTTN